MPRQKDNAEQRQSQSNGAPVERRLPAAAKWVVSVLLVFHLLAISWGPFAFSTSSSDRRSEVTELLAFLVMPYAHIFDLDHGYHFFAPNPGPSHVINYELTMPDGTTRSGTFPDLDEQWPRLLYHRYFMLSEFVNYPPAGPPQLWSQVPPPPNTNDQNPHFDDYLRAYANHLQAESGATKVKLTHQKRLLITLEDWEQGRQQTDPKLLHFRRLWPLPPPRPRGDPPGVSPRRRRPPESVRPPEDMQPPASIRRPDDRPEDVPVEVLP